MEDMMKLADVSCEEVYEKVSDSWVGHMSVPNGFDKFDDEGDDLWGVCEVSKPIIFFEGIVNPPSEIGAIRNIFIYNIYIIG